MLARQLLVAFLLVTVPGTLVLSGVTFYSLSSLRAVSHQLAEIMLSLEGTRDVNFALNQAERPLVDELTRPDPGNRVAFERLVQSVELKIATCGASRCHAEGGVAVGEVRMLLPVVEQIRSAAGTVFDHPPGDTSRSAAAIEQVREAAAQGRGQLHRMSAALLDRVGDLGRRSHEVSRRAATLTGVLTVTVLLLAGLAALVSARRIARPLNELLVGIRRLMGGDLSTRVQVSARGELGEVAAAFNAMAGELQRARARNEEYNRTLEQRVRERTEELAHKEQALAQSERLASLGLLAAGVAHELNNPLTSIVMNAHLMMEDVGEGSPLHESLRKIDAEAGRCRRIVDDLRAFARRRDMRPSSSDVDTVLEQALWSARHEIEQRKIAVSREVAADLPTIVWDVDRMVQVFTNLVANAAQAMEHGGELSIRAARDNGWLRLDVSDTGPGIPADLRGKIFDPFFTTKRDGTGLGLSICHGIVMTHGGRIDVQTRTREEAGAAGPTGTTVTVRVPLAETAA